MKNPNPPPLSKQSVCAEVEQLIRRSGALADESNEVCSELDVIADLQAHLVVLASDLNTTLRFQTGALSGLKPAFYASVQSAHVPWVVGPCTYFTALHELGHAALNRPGGQSDEQVLDEEIDAWKWAFDKSIVTPTPSVHEYIEALLDQYRHKVACQICGTTVEIRYEDDPEVYEAHWKAMLG